MNRAAIVSPSTISSSRKLFIDSHGWTSHPWHPSARLFAGQRLQKSRDEIHDAGAVAVLCHFANPADNSTADNHAVGDFRELPDVCRLADAKADADGDAGMLAKLGDAHRQVLWQLAALPGDAGD